MRQSSVPRRRSINGSFCARPSSDGRRAVIILTAKQLIQVVSDYNPNALRPKSGLGGARSFRIYWGEGSKRADLSPARMPIPVPFSPIRRDCFCSRSNRRNTWSVYGAHSASWNKSKKKIPYGFDLFMSHYFISLENTSANESEFKKMFASPAQILNGVRSISTIFYDARR